MPELEAIVPAARAHRSENSRSACYNQRFDLHKLLCARWLCRITTAGRAGVPTGPTKNSEAPSSFFTT
jgi:hypothetical protein